MCMQVGIVERMVKLGRRTSTMRQSVDGARNYHLEGLARY